MKSDSLSRLRLTFVLAVSLCALATPRIEGKGPVPFLGSLVNNTLSDSLLNLECANDGGYPNSVSCSDSEWFVQGYSQYREDLSDSGLLPYGQVKCCKPDNFAIQVKCTARKNVKNCAFMRHHPSNLSSFLSGFSNSLRIDTEYAPEGEAICCDAIAVQNGIRRYITPCDCVVTDDVMCPPSGQGDTHYARVMTGFLSTTNIGVPLTPAECCS